MNDTRDCEKEKLDKKGLIWIYVDLNIASKFSA